MKKRPQPKKQTSPADNRAKIEYTALLPFLVILLLLLIGSFQKSYYFWGISAWSVIDSGLALSVLAGGLALILLLLTSPIRKVLERLMNQASVIVDRTPRFLSVTLISILLFSLFYSLRSKALVYGDGFSMLEILSAPVNSGISGQIYLQLLSTLVNRFLINLTVSYFGFSPQNSLAIINILGGILACWALIVVAKKLSEKPSQSLFIFFATMSSGSVLLFFGHVENYTWPLSLSLWCVYFTIKYLHRESNWLPMTAFGLLAFLFHAITTPFLVVVGMAIYFKKRKTAAKLLNQSHRRNMMFVAIGVLVLICVWQTVIHASYPELPRVFVNLWPQVYNPYWFLSWDHIIDVLNLLFFLAPIGIFLLILQFLAKDRSDIVDPIERILAWLTFLLFLELFWIDPELGAPRDWDLLAISGFPLSLWAVYRFSKYSTLKLNQSMLAIAAIVVAVCHIAPHIYEINNETIATERLDALLWECPQYQINYDQAFRGISWATTLNEQLSRSDLAEKYFLRRLSVNQSSSSWFNLGQVYHSRGAIDSSAVAFTNAVKLDPQNSLYLLKLADVKNRQDRNLEALALANKSEALDPENPTTHTTKAIILAGLGRVEESLIHFRKAQGLAPNGLDQNYNLGAIYYALSDFEKAYTYLKRAMEIDPQAEQVYGKLIPVQLELGKSAEAEATLNKYRRLNPKAGSLEYYRKVLKE